MTEEVRQGNVDDGTAVLAPNWLLRWPNRGSASGAEIDQVSVGFYQALGFTVESLGEKYPGVKRFRARRSQIR